MRRWFSRRAVTWLLTLGVGAGLGWQAGQATIFEVLLVGVMAVGTVLGALLLVPLARLFRGPGPTPPTLALLALTALLTIGVAIGSLSRAGSRRAQLFTRAVPALRQYQRLHGAYPDSLAELGPGFADSELYYAPDPARQQFWLSVLVDGWHRRGYDSRTGAYSSGD